MSTISAGTTSTTALVSTGDTTGNLILATGATPTTALTLNSTTQAATFAGAVTAPSVTTTGSTGSLNAINTFGFKNRIINGGMTIDQRNAGASQTFGSTTVAGNYYGYSVDRWQIQDYTTTASSGVAFTTQQNAGAVTPPAGFINYLGVTVTTSQASLSATTICRIYQRIEGLNVADLGWGTANAKTITLSAWVRSSLTGTFGGALSNSAGNRSYPFTYTISSANTWTQVSVTIAGDTSGTWLTTNGIGIDVIFSLGANSASLGTAGSWGSATYYGATGQTNVVSTNAATFYITGVQLEVGSQATSFDFRDYGRELILCQRYYETASYGLTGAAFSSTGWVAGWRYQVAKRTTPTLSNGSVLTISDPTVGNYTQSSVNFQGSNTGTLGAQILLGNFSGLTTYRPYFSMGGTETTAMTASAEL